MKKKVKKIVSSLKIFVAIALATSLFVFAFYSFTGKVVARNVYVADKNLSGKTKEQSFEILSNLPKPKTYTITIEGQNYDIDSQLISVQYDYSKTVDHAFNLGKTGKVYSDLLTHFYLMNKSIDVGFTVSINEALLKENLAIASSQIVKNPTPPSIIKEEGFVKIINGSPGNFLDLDAAVALVIDAISKNKNQVKIPLTAIDPTLSVDEVNHLQRRAQNIIDKKISLVFEDEHFDYLSDDLFLVLDARNQYNEDQLNILIDVLIEKVDRHPKDAVFKYVNGKVEEFIPSQEGVVVNKEKLKEEIISGLYDLESSEESDVIVNIPYTIEPPKITTKDVNNLGIKEQIGKGHSFFRGSISSRIHNISVASSQFNGVLLSPGETLSFNQILGDVSEFTGYKKAYVIKDGKTVLGDGGGVCQVSTTLFRAALDAGLSIVERRPHSYRVGYYEQGFGPGIDATVYSPTTDLKIQNNTPAHILIQTIFSPQTSRLDFEIYGTSDGRIATTTKPIISSTTPPPEDLYQDDPNLPIGTIEQIEHKAWGAKTSFSYKVVRDGEIIEEKTFYSNYRPWQAVYLRGTKPL